MDIGPIILFVFIINKAILADRRLGAAAEQQHPDRRLGAAAEQQHQMNTTAASLLSSIPVIEWYVLGAFLMVFLIASLPWVVFFLVPCVGGGSGSSIPCTRPKPKTALAVVQAPGVCCCCGYFACHALGVRVQPCDDGKRNLCLWAAQDALRHAEALVPSEGGSIVRDWRGIEVGEDEGVDNANTTVPLPLCAVPDVIATAHGALGLFFHDLDRTFRLLFSLAFFLVLPLSVLATLRNVAISTGGNNCEAESDGFRLPMAWLTSASAPSPLVFAAFLPTTLSKTARDSSSCWTWSGSESGRNIAVDITLAALGLLIAFIPLLIFALLAMRARVQWRNIQRRRDAPAQYTISFRAIGRDAEGAPMAAPTALAVSAAFGKWGAVSQVVVNAEIDRKLLALSAEAKKLHGAHSRAFHFAKKALDGSSRMEGRYETAQANLRERQLTLRSLRDARKEAPSSESVVFVSFQQAEDAQQCYDDLCADAMRYVGENRDGGGALRHRSKADGGAYTALLGGHLVRMVAAAPAHEDILWMNLLDSAFQPATPSMRRYRLRTCVRVVGRLSAAVGLLLVVIAVFTATTLTFVLGVRNISDTGSVTTCDAISGDEQNHLGGMSGPLFIRSIAIALSLVSDVTHYVFRAHLLPVVILLLQPHTKSARKMAKMAIIYIVELTHIALVFAIAYILTAAKTHQLFCKNYALAGTEEMCLASQNFTTMGRIGYFIMIRQITSAFAIVVEEFLHPIVWVRRLVCFCCCRGLRSREELRAAWLPEPPQLWALHVHTVGTVFLSLTAAIAYPVAFLAGIYKLVLMSAIMRVAALRTRPAPPLSSPAIYTMTKVLYVVAAIIAAVFNFALVVFLVTQQRLFSERLAEREAGKSDTRSVDEFTEAGLAVSFAWIQPLLACIAVVAGYGVCSARCSRHGNKRQCFVCGGISLATVACGALPAATVVLCALPYEVVGLRQPSAYPGTVPVVLEWGYFALCIALSLSIGIGGSAASVVAFRVSARKEELLGTWRGGPVFVARAMLAATALGVAACVVATAAIILTGAIDFTPNLATREISRAGDHAEQWSLNCEASGGVGHTPMQSFVALGTATAAVALGALGTALAACIVSCCSERCASRGEVAAAAAAMSPPVVEMAQRPMSTRGSSLKHLADSTTDDVQLNIDLPHLHRATVPGLQDTTIATFTRLVERGLLDYVPSARDVAEAKLHDLSEREAKQRAHEAQIEAWKQHTVQQHINNMAGGAPEVEPELKAAGLMRSDSLAMLMTNSDGTPIRKSLYIRRANRRERRMSRELRVAEKAKKLETSGVRATELGDAAAKAMVTSALKKKEPEGSELLPAGSVVDMKVHIKATEIKAMEEMNEKELKQVIAALRRYGNGAYSDNNMKCKFCTPLCLFNSDVTRLEWALRDAHAPLKKPTWSATLAQWRAQNRIYGDVAVPFAPPPGGRAQTEIWQVNVGSQLWVVGEGIANTTVAKLGAKLRRARVVVAAKALCGGGKEKKPARVVVAAKALHIHSKAQGGV